MCEKKNAGIDFQYEHASRLVDLYSKLQDDMSRRVFWARLQCDTAFSMSNLFSLFLLSGYLTEDEEAYCFCWKGKMKELQELGKKIILYGAGTCGKVIGEALLADGCDFFAFCDGSKERQSQEGSLLGKPVVSPEYVIGNKEDCYVIICAQNSYTEIVDILRKNDFDETHIVRFFDGLMRDNSSKIETQYFVFPEYYKKGTALVDAGSYDGKDSLYFANWCKGEYSKIFAFEPDRLNYEMCRDNFVKWEMKNVELLEAGLSADGKDKKFASSDDTRYNNYLITEELEETIPLGVRGKQNQISIVQTCKLDDMMKTDTVGFIKMDIEGAELEALKGAEETIIRDRPFLAISTYHRRGDLLVLMSYLNTIVPEYRFFLRHYGALASETVLYATVQKAEERIR